TAEPAAAPARPEPLAEAPRRVLIVDDNRDGADSLATLLQLLGHEVRTEYSAEGALAHVRGFDPHLVLLDIGLPRIDGYEVARRMRTASPTRRLIALSGYGRNEDQQRSAEAGFDAHLIKPVDLAELRRVIASAS